MNGEFNNILNNPIALISPTTGPINFNLQAHTGLIPSAITATSGSAGQVLTVVGGATVFSNSAAAVGSRVNGLRAVVSSQTGTFSGNQYLVQTTNAGQSFLLVSTAGFAVSVGTAGPAAGGRDIAGVFASTEVHWYMITTGANSTTVAGIVSTATPPNGPVLPVGYSAWAYLGGSAYSSSSTTVASDHAFRGNKSFYNVAFPVLTNGTATVETAVSVSTAVPANALSFGLTGTATPVGAGGNIDLQLLIRTVTGNSVYAPRVGIYGGLGGVNQVISWALGPVVNTSSQQFLYLHTLTTGTIGNGSTLQIPYYEMPNGDA